MNKKNLKIIPVIVLTIVIFVLSSLKQKVPPTLGFKLNSLFMVLHTGEFGLFSMLLMFGFYPQIKAYFLLMVSILYGILDEIHQYFVLTRFFDEIDIFCNIIGAILGMFVYLFLKVLFEELEYFKQNINLVEDGRK